MVNGYFKKSLVLGILFLFLGGCVLPSVCAKQNIEEKIKTTSLERGFYLNSDFNLSLNNNGFHLTTNYFWFFGDFCLFSITRSIGLNEKCMANLSITDSSGQNYQYQVYGFFYFLTFYIKNFDTNSGYMSGHSTFLMFYTKSSR